MSDVQPTCSDQDAVREVMHGALQQELTQREILAELRATRVLMERVVRLLEAVTDGGRAMPVEVLPG